MSYSTMSTEIQFFHTKSCQTEPDVDVRRPSHSRRLRYIHFKRIGSCQFDTPRDITYDARQVLVDRGVVFDPTDLLSNRGTYSKRLTEIISSWMPSVPEDEHPDIVAKTFEAVEVAIPGLLIDIFVVETTVRLLGSARTVEEYHKIVDKLTMEFMHISKRVAATKLSIGGLEKVSLDSLDLTVRRTPCIICREDLDHSDIVDDGIIHPPVITRLPCSHLYHGGCIVDWLLIRHWCPLCRYSIPVVRVPRELPSLEGMGMGPILKRVRRLLVHLTDNQPIVDVAGEPSITSSQVDWPMLLNMSAGGILTAMLLCRLLK